MIANSSNLKTIRVNLGVTVKEASKASGVPLRTYLRYEKDENYGNSLKKEAMIRSLEEAYSVNEEKGMLTLEAIKSSVSKVMGAYKDSIQFCYLFGSYAKGYANEKSDVDLCVSTALSGFEFLALLEKLKETLNKKVDLLRLSEAKEDEALLIEIMKGGFKIYG